VPSLPGDSRRHRLPARTVRYWQVINGLLFLPLLVVVAVVAHFWTGLPDWLRIGAVAAAAVTVLASILIDAPLRYRRFSYAIGETEIDIEEGLLVVTRTVVPMSRVQHLRMAHGVIADRFRLADLHIHTGAGAVTLPGLGRDEAEAIRVRVSELAHLSDDL